MASCPKCGAANIKRRKGVKKCKYCGIFEDKQVETFKAEFEIDANSQYETEQTLIDLFVTVPNCKVLMENKNVHDDKFFNPSSIKLKVKGILPCG